MCDESPIKKQSHVPVGSYFLWIFLRLKMQKFEHASDDEKKYYLIKNNDFFFFFKQLFKNVVTRKKSSDKD